MRAIFIHGVGISGADAWSRQVALQNKDWLFLERATEGDNPNRDAGRVTQLLVESGGGALVAHSYGANAALLAAQRNPELVRALVLFEPACFDLARGQVAVEQEIEKMTPVMDAAQDQDMSDLEFFSFFAEKVGMPIPQLPADVLAAEAAGIRALAAPWGTGLDSDQVLPPTVIVTSGENELYTAVAESLVARGAQHIVIPGTGHRPQDLADVSELIDSLL